MDDPFSAGQLRRRRAAARRLALALAVAALLLYLAGFWVGRG